MLNWDNVKHISNTSTKKTESKAKTSKTLDWSNVKHSKIASTTPIPTAEEEAKLQRNQSKQKVIDSISREVTTPANSIDQRVYLGGNKDNGYNYIGRNILPAKQTDSTLAKVGKGIVNYGGGTVLNTLGSVTQGMMQGAGAVDSLIRGKKIDTSEKSLTKDIFPTVGKGLENLSKKGKAGEFASGFLGAAFESAVDPTTYVGGGIVDDLAKAGRFGAAGKLGTTENLLYQAERNANIIKKIRAKELLTAKEIEEVKNSPELLQLPEVKQLLLPEHATSKIEVGPVTTTPKVNAIKPDFYASGNNIAKNAADFTIPPKSQLALPEGKTIVPEGKNIVNPKTVIDKIREDLAIPSHSTTSGKIETPLQVTKKELYGKKYPSNLQKLSTQIKQENKAAAAIKAGEHSNIGNKFDFVKSPTAYKNNSLYKVSDQFKREQPLKVLPGELANKKFEAPKLVDLEKVMGKTNTAKATVVNAAEKLKDDTVYNDIVKNLEGSNVKADTNIQDIATTVKDKSGLSLNLKDVYRNMRDTFGKNFDYVKKNYLDPFDASKKAYVNEVKSNTDSIYNKVVKELGITKGSKESAAVQNFGEKIKIVDGKEVPYGYSDVVKEFGKAKADKIVNADSIFRKQYNELINKVNSVRQQLYPNNPDKKVPKRSDYYRHFQEMAEGFEGLKNIFDTPSQIDPKLAGISEFVKPKSKWASYMQKRGKGAYKADAVGGFLDYVQPAAYSIHIDPNINKFRQLAKDLAEGTADTRNANNTIKWLNDFANSLAGKTNKYDRIIQEDIPGGRTAFRALNWLNGRIKANEVLGKFSSAVSQFANVPVAIARIKNPIAISKGIGQTLASIVGKGNKAIKNSGFINERYMGDLLTRFNTKLIDKPKEMAAWLMESADKIGTMFTWNSAYNQAVSKGIVNPVQYADNLTRSIVAGRGIGEVPLWQQAKRNQLIAPFQLEVANLWHVMGDMSKEKDFAGIALLLLGNYMFNNATEGLTGNRVTFDPIDAMMDALSEEDTNALKVGGRLAGEVLSNIPLGQTIAAMYPEYSTEISSPVGNIKFPSRKELFGDNDPTRFGGGILASKALSDPLYKVVPQFGGAQLKKTIEGLQSVNQGAVEKDGKLRFPVAQTPRNYIQSALFGKYSTPEAREYFNNDRRPLSEKQTQDIKASTNMKAEYDKLMARRTIETIRDKISKLQKDNSNSEHQKNTKLDELRKELEKARAMYNKLPK